MGCGKTTLREKLAFPGFDFDQELLRRFGKADESMDGFINRIGWEDFREEEFNLFNNVLENSESGVFSLGGGCLIDQRFRWKFPNGSNEKLIWMKTPIEICWERVRNSKERPLVQKGQKEFIALYEQRLDFYKQANISSDSEKEIGQIVTDAIGQDL